MRKLATVAVAVGLFVGGMGTAVADGWHKMRRMDTQGVAFEDGAYVFERKGHNRGAFHFKGALRDALDDGHNVYVEVKVEGYDWNRFKGKQNRVVQLDKLVYDGAAQYTSKAWIRACRDRGSLRPDNCADTQHHRRPGH